jgi:hypothetical protein
MPVETGKIPRRAVRFQVIDEAIAEGDRLAAAAKEGRLTLKGNWTLGQILNHLATWGEFAYTGTPVKVPGLLRLLIRPMKGRFLRRGMPAGRSIPSVKKGTFGTEDVPVDKALQRFQIAFLRLKNEAPTAPHPFFGRMTHPEWMALHLRHAELHFSFADVS